MNFPWLMGNRPASHTGYGRGVHNVGDEWRKAAQPVVGVQFKSPGKREYLTSKTASQADANVNRSVHLYCARTRRAVSLIELEPGPITKVPNPSAANHGASCGESPTDPAVWPSGAFRQAVTTSGKSAWLFQIGGHARQIMVST